MLLSLNSIAEQQAYPTQNTQGAIKRFLDYAATNPDAIVKFRAIDMVIHIESDISYLYEAHKHRHTGGIYNPSSQPAHTKKASNLIPPENVPKHT